MIDKIEKLAELKRKFDRSVKIRQAFNIPMDENVTVTKTKPSGVSANDRRLDDKLRVQIRHSNTVIEVSNKKFKELMGE